MEDVRVWLFYWLLNYWRVFRPEHFDMGDMWREIMESIPDLPECALEGCDYVLFGYRPQAICCCRNHSTKAWFKRNPGYKKKMSNKPEYKKAAKKRKKIRQQNPEYQKYMKVYQKAYREANKEKAKAYQKAYYEANKDKMNVLDRARRARKKAEKNNDTNPLPPGL